MIGTGTYGVVFKVIHIKSGEEFAVKEIAKEGYQNAKEKDYLKNELITLQLINHPNIMTVY